VPVDQKPTKSDQPDADEYDKTALAERKGEAKQRHREIGTQYKMGIRGDQTNR